MGGTGSGNHGGRQEDDASRLIRLLALLSPPFTSKFSYADGRQTAPIHGEGHSARGGGVQRLPRAFTLQ
jgi:hypothetical protein